MTRAEGPKFERILAPALIVERTGARVWRAKMPNAKIVTAYARKIDVVELKPGDTVTLAFAPVDLDTGRIQVPQG